MIEAAQIEEEAYYNKWYASRELVWTMVKLFWDNLEKKYAPRELVWTMVRLFWDNLENKMHPEK